MIQTILENTLLYTIELLKLFIFCISLLKIQLKYFRAAIAASFGSILFFAVLSFYTDILHSGIPLGIMPGIIIFFCMTEKKQIYLVALAYILTCIADTIISAIVMFILHTGPKNIYYNFTVSVFTNCISLFLLLFLHAKRINIVRLLRDVPAKIIVLFIMGCLSLGTYIAVLQIIGFSDNNNFYISLLALSLTILSIIFLITGFLLLSRQNQLTHLQKEFEMSQNVLAAQKDYYLSLLKKESETKSFRHDLQNHITCMHALYLEGNYTELESYLVQLNSSLQQLKPELKTGNELVNAIVTDISHRHNQVQLDWKGHLPGRLRLTSMDLCTIFSNLLNNAFEAAKQTNNKIVLVSVKILGSSLVLTIANSAARAPIFHHGEYVSTKKGKTHGFGIHNAVQCIQKNGGNFETSFENGLFTVEITLLDALYVNI